MGAGLRGLSACCGCDYSRTVIPQVLRMICTAVLYDLYFVYFTALYSSTAAVPGTTPDL